MVATEDEKKFHKRKIVDALDKMKTAVIKEDVDSANREQMVARHHLEEVKRLKSEED
jgi:F0F1-type ATP synthase membrane subunit b/b'